MLLGPYSAPGPNSGGFLYTFPARGADPWTWGTSTFFKISFSPRNAIISPKDYDFRMLVVPYILLGPFVVPSRNSCGYLYIFPAARAAPWGRGVSTFFKNEVSKFPPADANLAVFGEPYFRSRPITWPSWNSWG